MTTTQLIAEALYARVDSPIRGAGPCLVVVRELEGLLTSFVRQVQSMQRHGQLLDLPAEVVARRLTLETVQPGAGVDVEVEVW